MQEKENQTDNGTDVLIVGAGIAGLSTAIKLATYFPESRITLISKDKPGEPAAHYLCGGIVTNIKSQTSIKNEIQLQRIRQALKECMANSAGIVCSFTSLHSGLEKINKLNCTIEQIAKNSKPNWLLYETRNIITVGMLILHQALEQTQNQGTHYNLDLEKVEKKEASIIL